jgi:GYF domain 2
MPIEPWKDTPEDGWHVLGWYYDSDQGRRGPFTRENLRQLVEAGQVGPDSKVYVAWKGGNEVQYLESELRLALGEPGNLPSVRPAPPAPEPIATPAPISTAQEMVALHCPRCNRCDVYTSRLRWYDLPAAVLFLRPFRCARCGRRFYRFAWRAGAMRRI